MQETAFYIAKGCLLQGKMPPFVLLAFISRFLLHIRVMCRLSSLSLYPFHYYVYGVLLFVIRQFMAFFMPCHFSMQPRQQHPVACCAVNTGCPRIGVCLPSLGINAGASLLRTKSPACRRIVASPFRSIYSMSSMPSLNLLLNCDFESLANKSSRSYCVWPSAISLSLTFHSSAKRSPSSGSFLCLFLPCVIGLVFISYSSGCKVT
mgnify:CR=1 FL=1